jgi:hypothetical protein
MSLDFVGCSSESFFAVLLVGLTVLNFLAFLLEFTESGAELVSFVGQFAHLAEKNDVGQIQSAVLVVVGEVCLGVCVVHQYCE